MVHSYYYIHLFLLYLLALSFPKLMYGDLLHVTNFVIIRMILYIMYIV
jgi:hypothetical protein